MENPFHIINKATDLKHGYAPRHGFEFTKTDLAVPIVATEITNVLPFFPIAFAQVQQGVWELVALLSLEQGRNLCVSDDGKWRLPYIPERYRVAPFSNVKAKVNDEIHFALSFNTRTGLYREAPDVEKGEQRFFNDDGELTNEVKQRVEFLNRHSRTHNTTVNIVKALADEKVLVGWNVSKTIDIDEDKQLKGFYRIDEAALNKLDSDALMRLHKLNALPIVYAQLLSIQRVEILKTIYQQTQQNTEVDADLVEKMFDQQDDTIKFNF